MKAIILRRAEEISDEELGDNEEGDIDSDLDAADRVRINGDGEASDNESIEPADKDGDTTSPETICELAYIKDPKLFDRDANTRRSVARQELKTKTGMLNIHQVAIY